MSDNEILIGKFIRFSSRDIRVVTVLRNSKVVQVFDAARSDLTVPRDSRHKKSLKTIVKKFSQSFLKTVDR